MENNINILTLKDIKGYTLDILFKPNLWFGDYFYIIEIRDIIGNIVYSSNIHYDHLMHILFNDLPTLYEYSEPFVQEIPITSTTHNSTIYGYDSEKENITLAFKQTNIISNSNKTIELSFERDTIYNILQSGELVEKMTI